MGVAASIDCDIASRLFSSAVLREWAVKGHSALAIRIREESGIPSSWLGRFKTVRNFYERLFQMNLECGTELEYFYKAALYKMIVQSHQCSGVHSSDVKVIPEFRVGSCRCDLAVFNGTSTAYEIKTAKDNDVRLSSQLAEYAKFFEKVYVVLSEDNYNILKLRIPMNVGILVKLKNKREFINCRLAKSNIDMLRKDVLFGVLRQSEYAQVLANMGKIVPDGIKPVNLYRFAKESFFCLDKEVMHKEVVSLLRKRKDAISYSEYGTAFPEALFLRFLTSRYTKQELLNLQSVFESAPAKIFY